MSGPIVFISRNRVRPGRLADITTFLSTGAPQLEREKPRTLAFLPFLSEDGGEVTIVHVFADAAAFEAHVEGAEDRSRAAYELIEPVSFEIFGSPSSAVLESFRAASADGLGLDLHPAALPGFLRGG